MKDYSVTELAANEWNDFSIYSALGRHIASMIDGMKPSQRFFLTSALADARSSFDKVASIAGGVAKYGYRHGEENAGNAGVGMAQKWENNACLILGRGSFGTRLVPKAASPRYIYARVHPDFDKLVRDLDLVPPAKETDVKIPMHYVPVVPLILVNGTNGVATGFRASILPRSLKDVTQACLEYIKTGKIKNKLIPSWNEYTGTVEEVGPRKYLVRGVFERQGKTGLTISEVPMGFDREDYIKLLDDLEDAKSISGYVDACGKSGFGFRVQLPRGNDLTDEAIVKMFKLATPMTEILTTVDENGELKIYEDVKDIVKDFCDYRRSILIKRIANREAEAVENARFYRVKAEFVKRVLDSKIVFKGHTKAQIAASILEIREALEDDVDRLLRMNLLSLTKEMVDELIAAEAKVVQEISFWRSETWESQFKADLSGIK